MISVLAIFRGLSDIVPSKVRDLQNVTGIRYFSKICTVGGAMLFTVVIFGFWCADAESRGGLITVKFRATHLLRSLAAAYLVHQVLNNNVLIAAV